MKEETVKTLSELYAIRAVMSTVSKNEDETHDIETEEKHSLSAQIDSIQKSIDETEREIEQKHTHKPEIEELDKLIKQKEEEKDSLEIKINERKKDIKIEIALGLLAFFLIAPIFIWLIYIITGGDELVFIISPPFYVFTFALSIVIIYWADTWNLKKNTTNYRKNKSAFKDCESVLTEYYIQRADLTQGSEKGDKYTPKGLELKAEIEKKKKEIIAIEDKIDEGFKRAEEIKSQSAEIIRQAKLFFDIVNYIDWDGLDIICYYIETGRADKIKEALFKIDAERKNKTFDLTVRHANQQICRSACYSADEITYGLDNILGKFISSLNAKRDEDDNTPTKGGCEPIVRVEEDRTDCGIYSVQEFKDALNDKIGVASNRLAEDMQSQLKMRETD
ncbi:MAG: coiled-coil domain-containing protein [Candidatus Coproplasma sp.]